jgi:hypothetical protein
MGGNLNLSARLDQFTYYYYRAQTSRRHGCSTRRDATPRRDRELTNVNGEQCTDPVLNVWLAHCSQPNSAAETCTCWTRVMSSASLGSFTYHHASRCVGI